MSSNLPFPLADLYDALVAKNLEQKIQPFIAQFRKRNIYIIYQCINRFIQILTNKSQLPIMKFNALMATRYFFDTCEYPAVIFIEVFMLPVIYQIALQKYLKSSEQEIQLYFVDRGAQNTKQMRRLGLNFVQLATEFIFNSAKVKPHRLVQNRQLKQQSNFARTVKVLNSKGIKQQEKCKYYFPSYPSITNKKLINKLSHLSAQPYISFVVSQYLQQINLGKKCDLDIKKLLMFGDSFLTSTMVQIIQEELSHMESNFINKRKYLGLLNDLVRSGEIQSIYLLSTAEFTTQIARQVGKVKGQLGNQQGECIYPKIQASKQEKKQFYIQFLRVLQIWAYCMPLTDQGQKSDILSTFQFLQDKDFIFPENTALPKIKKQMEDNLLLNQQRNDELMKIIDEDERAQSRNLGSYVSSGGQFKFSFPEYTDKKQSMQIDELQLKVLEAKQKIAGLTLRKQDLRQNMHCLQSFYNNWPVNLQALDVEDQDPHQLQILIDQGDLCCKQYKLVVPIYDLYEKGEINHDAFIRMIQFLENTSQNYICDSQKDQEDINASIEHELQTSKKPDVSQSVRKHVQPKRKSILKHSVISKSSYHSQPPQPKLIQSNEHFQVNQSCSMINDYQMQQNHVNYIKQAGVTVKKLSIKKTQNSAIRSSSHKKQNSSSHHQQKNMLTDAMSPFQKKQFSSKYAKFKQSNSKQLIKNDKKLTSPKINQNFAYEEVFKQNSYHENRKNQSQVSSQNQSLIIKRNIRQKQKHQIRQTDQIEENYLSEYYYQQIQKVRQGQDIGQIRINKITDKISQLNGNASKLFNFKSKNSGIKVVSKQGHKNFDTLYKDQQIANGESISNNLHQETSSGYKQGIGLLKGKAIKSQNQNRKLKQSQIENKNDGLTSRQQLKREIGRYINQPKDYRDLQISEINEPKNVPMLYSYYSDKSIYSKMVDSRTRNGNCSSNQNEFKACYLNMDKEILPLDLNRTKAVSSSFSLDKAHNFISFRCSIVNSSSKLNTVADEMSQKNAKNSILLYRLQRQKNRLVQNLQNKIKSLQVDSKMMKTKIAVKEQSIRESRQSLQFSQRQLKFNTRQFRSPRQASDHTNSLQMELFNSKNRPTTKNMDQQNIETPQFQADQTRKLINTQIYHKFFDDFKRHSGNKTLYKKKGILVKNQQIQIGYMSSKKDDTLFISIFITPLVSSILNIVSEVQCDDGLSYEIANSRVDLIQMNKQEIIICSFHAKKVPFKIPTINIEFDPNQKNYMINSYTLGIPCTMLDFSEISELNQKSQDITTKEFLRTQIFKCQNKISKIQKFKQVLPTFKYVQVSTKINKFQGALTYEDLTFCISLTLNDMGYIYIEGSCTDRHNQNTKFLQYLLATIRFMLESQVPKRECRTINPK